MKDAANYPDLRGHMGWNPTNVLLNMHDRSLRDIAERIVEALRELEERGARQAIVSSSSAAIKVGTGVP